ncbi:MAG: Gldg family protein, partial [Bacteroidota bacterium]
MKSFDKIKSLDALATAASVLAILFLAAGILVPYLKGPAVLVPWLRGSGALFLLFFLLLLAWIRRADLVRVLGHKRTKSGAQSTLQIVLFLGVLVCLNLIVGGYHGRLDLTSTREYSLSDQTRKILKNLKQEVTVTSFFQPGNKAQELW